PLPATPVSRTPTRPLPAPRTSYSSHEAWLDDEPVSAVPVFPYFGQSLSYYEYARRPAVPLRRTDGTSIMDRPTVVSPPIPSPPPMPTIPVVMPARRPPKPNYPPPVFDVERNCYISFRPGYFPISRPLGPPSVRSVQDIMEDIEDEQFMWSYAPSADDVSEALEREREDQR
ncbi:hypothetical protein FOL46_005279, partial [Perkinsus olseni]